MRTRRSVRPAHALAGLLLAAGLALSGCSGGADSTSAGDDKAAGAQDRPAAQDLGKASTAEGAGSAGSKSSPVPSLPVANHVIRTATLVVQVKDVPKALDRARATAEDAGGYVGNETTVRDEDSTEETRVVLRVPADRYDDVLEGLEGTGKLLERTVKARDVSDEVVDVDSRIASQQASVKRLRKLMDQAAKLSDVVTLEGELSRREADLESLLARQGSLKDRTSMATITLTLSEKPVPVVEQDDDPGFTDALAGGWDAFVTTLRWIIVAFAAVLPFAAVAGVLLLVWLRLRRGRRPVRAARFEQD